MAFLAFYPKIRNRLLSAEHKGSLVQSGMTNPCFYVFCIKWPPDGFDTLSFLCTLLFINSQLTDGESVVVCLAVQQLLT